jgi:uncharacterized membrane protein YphA (DoxX/SURF4 family)
MNKLVNKISNSIINIPHITLVSVVLIIAIFFVAGYKKIRSFAKTQAWITEKIGKIVTLPKSINQLLTSLVIAFEIIAPLAIVYSMIGTQTDAKRLIRHESILILIVLTVVATILCHNPMDEKETMNFLRNIGIVGALVLMLRL